MLIIDKFKVNMLILQVYEPIISLGYNMSNINNNNNNA